MQQLKWKRLGQIFDCAVHGLPEGFSGFAQSPQAIVFDEFIRIFFSTRKRETSSGKYLSYVVYADYSLDLSQLIRVADLPVMELGNLGTFDEHGIFPLSPLRVGDKIFGYTSGTSRRESVPVDAAIGLATSSDGGASFTRLSDGPILGPSLFEPCIVADAYVLNHEDVFHMWYIFGGPWRKYANADTPERTYRICHTTSFDGIHWNPSGGIQSIPTILGEEECQALPTVFHHAGLWHMIFCYRFASDFRSNPSRGYRLGLATSTDLEHWSRNDQALTFTGPAEGWDAQMQCYPNVFKVAGTTYLLYNGNAFGREGFGAAVLET
jgi:hypothetical protein